MAGKFFKFFTGKSLNHMDNTENNKTIKSTVIGTLPKKPQFRLYKKLNIYPALFKKI